MATIQCPYCTFISSSEDGRCQMCGRTFREHAPAKQIAPTPKKKGKKKGKRKGKGKTSNIIPPRMLSNFETATRRYGDPVSAAHAQATRDWFLGDKDNAEIDAALGRAKNDDGDGGGGSGAGAGVDDGVFRDLYATRHAPLMPPLSSRDLYATRRAPQMPSLTLLRRASEQRGYTGVKKAYREAARRNEDKRTKQTRKKLMRKDLNRRRASGLGQTGFLHGLKGSTGTIFRRKKRAEKARRAADIARFRQTIARQIGAPSARVKQLQPRSRKKGKRVRKGARHGYGSDGPFYYGGSKRKISKRRRRRRTRRTRRTRRYS